MTFGDLIELMRRDFLQDVGDVENLATLTDDDVAWPTSFLLASLMEAQRQVCKRKQDSIYDEITPCIVQPKMVAGQRTMQIDCRIIDIAWMMIGVDRVVKKTTRERLDQDEPSWRSNRYADYPGQFFTYNHTVYWDTIPAQDAVQDGVTMGVWRFPLNDNITIHDTPEVPEHRDLIYWTLYECYSKDDEETGETADKDRAKKYYDLFNAAFGEPKGNDVLAAQKEGSRDFSMVPPSYHANMTRRGMRLGNSRRRGWDFVNGR